MTYRLKNVRRLVLLAATAALALPSFAVRAEDVSAPAILQWFEGTYATQERRAGDVFKAGYGSVWLPPPGRADSGNQSVGYDVYDRFDLGSAGNPTLYGTATGLRTLTRAFDKVGVATHLDLVINHNGFRDKSTPGFEAAGGYPGFLLRDPSGDPSTDGDFHSPFAGGEIEGRVSGLIDIDYDKSISFVRNPGRAELYPDRQGPYLSVFDPRTGQSDIRVYQFNTSNPSTGDAVSEDVTGYMQRYAQWLVQSVGADGLRIDAAKHVEAKALNALDVAVYRANPRKLLDGSTANVFSYGEVFDSNRDFLLRGSNQSDAYDDFVRKDINPNDPGRIGGNRDVLDFHLRDALANNLTDNGFANDWRNVSSAGLDVYDDGKHNGSAGVAFVGSHDQGNGAFLNNVAHAYTLMQPGNAVVYFNAKEHGQGRDFPKDGRGDALGGQYGDTITELVNIRNTHGRGDYQERYTDKEYHAFERKGSMLVMLSNRNDGGASGDVRIGVALPVGTHLVELTGNAAAYGLSEVVTVGNDGNVGVRFLNNGGGDRGYLVYGLATPQGALSIGNVAQTIAPDSATAATNGSARATSVRVVKADAFGVTLNTNAVNLLGSIRDRDADGDNAILSIDGGLDLNGNGSVDFVTPGTVSYGFETFASASAGYNDASGNGSYAQTVDARNLSEGYHYLEVRAFRHRSDGGPANYSSFKETIYVDRLKPVSATSEADFKQFSTTNTKDRDLYVRSLDLTADSVHVLSNLGAALTDAQVLALVGAGNKAQVVDRDLFKKYFENIVNGNNVYTVVTFEMTGTWNVQRFAGISPETSIGFGLGDLTFDKYIEGNDLDSFVALYRTNNQQFNPAADLNADGQISHADWQLLGGELQRLHDAGLARPDGGPLVSDGTLAYYRSLGSQVPEPTTLAASLGLAGLLLRRRRAASRVN